MSFSEVPASMVAGESLQATSAELINKDVRIRRVLVNI